MKFSECKPADEMFAFTSDDGAHVLVNIEQLRAWVATHRDALQLHYVPIDWKAIMQWIKDNAINAGTMTSMTEDQRDEPVIFLEWHEPSGATTHMLGDGRHRYCRRYNDRYPVVSAYVLTPEQWGPFCIDDAPTLTEAEVRALLGKP